ncbi:MAG: hypothetical protein R3F14_21540 [Polyangiaceae bacterium]
MPPVGPFVRVTPSMTAVTYSHPAGSGLTLQSAGSTRRFPSRSAGTYCPRSVASLYAAIQYAASASNPTAWAR